MGLAPNPEDGPTAIAEALKPEITYVRAEDLFTDRVAWRAEVPVPDGRKCAGIGPTPFDALEELVIWLARHYAE